MMFVVLTAVILFFGVLEADSYISKKLYVVIAGGALLFFSGLRSLYVGTDSYSYAVGFARTEPFTLGSALSYLRQREPLFYIFRSIVRMFTDSYTPFFFAISAFYITAVSFFIYRYSKIPAIGYMLFMSMAYYTFSMAGLRQTAAMGFLIFAMDRIVNRRYFAAAALTITAFFFHVSSIIFLAAFLLWLLPLNKWFMAFAAALSLFIFAGGYTLVSIIVQFVWEEGRIYKEESGGTGTLMLLVAVAAAGLLLYPALWNAKHVKTGRDKSEKLRGRRRYVAKKVKKPVSSSRICADRAGYVQDRYNMGPSVKNPKERAGYARRFDPTFKNKSGRNTPGPAGRKATAAFELNANGAAKQNTGDYQNNQGLRPYYRRRHIGRADHAAPSAGAFVSAMPFGVQGMSDGRAGHPVCAAADGRDALCDSFFCKMLLASVPFQIMAVYQASAFRVAMLFHFAIVALVPNVISAQSDVRIRILGAIAVTAFVLYQLFAVTAGVGNILPYTFFWQV